jgi:membrane associated rhomboid family serine protease
MRYYNQPRYSGYGNQFFRPRLFSGAVKNIIIANIVVFVLMFVLGAERFFLFNFGLVPKFVWSRGFVWQLFTYMFIHGGFGHIFWNMFVLWMFGTEVETYLGRKEFYKFYFLAGIGSGLITLLFSLNSTIPVVGASGAIYAVLVAFALLFPNREIYLYFFFPIKAKYFVLIMAVITFFSTFSAGGSNISHLTHLGGLLIGYLYLRRPRLLAQIRFKLPKINLLNSIGNFLQRFFKVRRVAKKRPSQTPTRRDYDTDITMHEELDRLLDKISKKGYESLSSQEKQTLSLVSEYFAKKNDSKN